ncbi:MAG TPA: hypothetical protein VGA13_09790 [Acidimicrobiales bacterium]
MKRQTRHLLIAAAGVAAGIAMVVAVVVLGESGTIELQLGDETFGAGRADVMTDVIARDGPVLYPDLLGRDRPIWLQHLGEDPTRDWFAFDAIAPGADGRCVTEWRSAPDDADGGEFADPCSGAVFGARGVGLTRYRVDVVGGEVIVDLRAVRWVRS